MNTIWLRRLYDAGTRLEIWAERGLERLLGERLRRFFWRR